MTLLPKRLADGRSAFTLIELAVATGILLLLMALATPFILRYRANSSVNRSVELSKAVIEQAVELAKTSGSPLPDSLRQSGLPAATSTTPTASSYLYVRVRRRLSIDSEPQVVSERKLAPAETVLTDFQHLGSVDIDADPGLTGVFVEFLHRGGEDGEQIQASIAIDVNGEFLLEGKLANALIAFGHRDYSRTLEVTAQGTVRLDRR